MKNHDEITFRGVPVKLSYRYDLKDVNSDKSLKVALVAECKSRRASWVFDVNMEGQINPEQAMIDGGIHDIRATFRRIVLDNYQIPIIATLLSDEAETLVHELRKQLHEE